ncbi:FAD-dependent oxidoreductase [Bacteroides heparinolyticus]|uniref:FAD-dependent oxidoreductase n=1 Tax=Prevotella heparinolytica TaxID=28113 RepID=UPI0028F0D185|nr:FAD-dependent oxidoreductase [Bacteroides heparinolyticus]
MKHRYILLLVAIITFSPLLAKDILVEAESFEQKGGWAVDQQFMDLMGSPYLIAHGMGTPVADAVTEITIPEAGTYHVYVRTYNWTSPWHRGEGPGKFVLRIGNKKLNTVLGTKGSAWMWQSAGSVKLRAGKTKLAIHDLSGFDGRCDAIYLTTEKEPVLPETAEELAAFRRSKLHLPSEVPVAGQYDLVVVGAGIAGMSAAVSAARLGCKVALINDRPVVGGNNSSEIRVHLGGNIEIGKYKELGGLQKEFGPSRGGNAQPAEIYEDTKKMEWLSGEDNLALFINCRVVAVEKEGDRIVSVIGRHIETGKEMKFVAPLFVDCTGDGTVGYLAGAHYRMGREGKDEFGESRAPDKPDLLTMGASVQWYSTETDKPAVFPDFNYGVTFDDRTCEKVTLGEWTWETGMNKHQIYDFEQIRDYGMLVIYANWSYLKNRLKDNAPFRNRRLGWVAYVAGKRESRRLLGDYILKEGDMTKHVVHEDASFTASWSIDLHSPDPENGRNFPGNEFKAVTEHTLIYPYEVPYRCLYSRNVANLFMAGRNISVTHVALGSVRVMRTTGMMGEVVGMAASLCKKYNVGPRGIYWHHLEELKALMQKGVNRKGLPNNQRYNEAGMLNERPMIQ